MVRGSTVEPQRCINQGERMKIMIVLSMIAIGMADNADFISRLNYGVLATKSSDVTIIDDFWIATVHIELPQIPMFSRPDMGCTGWPFGAAINGTRCNSILKSIYLRVYMTFGLK